MDEWTGVTGKRVVLTGATNGIGLAAAEGLAALGAELTIVARSPERAATAVERIRGAAGDAPVPEVVTADLSSQAEVRRLAAQLLDRHERIDVLVNNAGAMFRARQLTVDGNGVFLNNPPAGDLTTSETPIFDVMQPQFASHGSSLRWGAFYSTNYTISVSGSCTSWPTRLGLCSTSIRRIR